MTEKTKRARQWKAFRKKHFFTQGSLAQVLGVGRETVNEIENGKTNPRPSTLHKFEMLKRKYEGEKWKVNRWQESPTKPIEPTVSQ